MQTVLAVDIAQKGLCNKGAVEVGGVPQALDVCEGEV